MNDTPIRRSNWPSSGGADTPARLDDPLAELERIVGRTTASATPAPAQPSAFRQPLSGNVPATGQSLPNAASAKESALDQKINAFVGIDEDEFEAAFRALEEKSSGKAPDRKIEKPPVFPPASSALKPTPAPVYGSTFSASATPAVKTPASPAFTQTPVAASPAFLQPPIAQKTSAIDYNDDWKPATKSFDYPDDTIAADAPLYAASTATNDFESRADNFDFDFKVDDEATDYDKVEPDYYEEPAPAYLTDRKPRSGIVTIAAVSGLVFIAVIAALLYSWRGAPSDGEALVVNADTSPVKVAPGEQAATPSNSKLIYDRLGNAADEADNEQVVSREEQPVDTLNAGNGTTSSGNSSLDAPRAVTTTTIRVKPDGTLETVPSAAAAVSPQSVTPPATSTQTPPLAAIAAPTVADPQNFARNTQANTAQTTAPSTADESEIASVDGDPVDNSQVTTTPSQPAATPTPVKPRVVANASPTQSSAKPVTTINGGGYVVQLSSQRNQASAQASFTSIQNKYPQVLAGYASSIKPVELGTKGTYYRVRVGPLNTRDEASALCTKLKSAGGDCVVTVN